MLIKRKKMKLSQMECDGMRAAGQFNAKLMDHVRSSIVAGISTSEIDQIVRQYTADHGHVAACLGYGGPQNPFPASCCTSVNEVVCHGIPSRYRLQEGDIINVDITTMVDGWFGDQSETFIVGNATQRVRQIVQCAFDCLYLAIDALQPGCRISTVGEVIVKHTSQFGFGVVDKYVGHGIGRRFHQPPNVSHVPTSEARRQYFEPGMCFTIEPMINGGTAKTVEDSLDGWTVRTADGEVSAQFEHTILMTEDGPEMLTLTQHGPRPGFQF